MVGIGFGSLFFGWIGDVLGRWWTTMFSILTTCIAGCGGAFVDSYEWYCVTRFLTGAGNLG